MSNHVLTNTLNWQRNELSKTQLLSLFIQDSKGSIPESKRIGHIYVQCEDVQNWGCCRETGLREEYEPRTALGNLVFMLLSVFRIAVRSTLFAAK